MRLLLLSLLAMTAKAQFPECNICGDEGLRVGNETGVINNPDGDPLSCIEVEANGDAGLIPPDQCEELQVFLEFQTCDCTTAQVDEEEPTATPVDDTTPPTAVDDGNATMIPSVDVTTMVPSAEMTTITPTADDTTALPVDTMVPTGDNMTSTMEPSATMTMAPSPGVTLPPPGTHEECNICGEGFEITKEDGLINDPLNNRTVTCAQVQIGGDMGVISPEQCTVLQNVTATICACMEVETEAPTTKEQTDAPTTGPPPPAPLPTKVPTVELDSAASNQGGYVLGIALLFLSVIW